MEAVGIIDEIGSGVPDRLKVDDAVMAIWRRKAAMARIANKLCLKSNGRARAYRRDPSCWVVPVVWTGFLEE